MAGQLGHMAVIAARGFKSMFSSTKYTVASMPFSGGVKILQDLMKENLKSVIDSEVDMFDEDSVHKAVENSAHADGVLAPGSAHARPSARPPST